MNHLEHSNTILLRLNDFDVCRVIERKNRFTVSIDMYGKSLDVHITNTGRLHEFLKKGRKGLVIPIRGKKLRYRLIGIDMGGYYALIDTKLQNIAFEYMVEKGLIPWLRGFRIIRRNPRVNDSLLDYLLVSGDGRELWVETKSAVLLGPDGAAMYPDCPSQRGRRHIREIINMNLSGLSATIIFIAGLRGVRCFRPYKEGDPVIHDLLTHLYRDVNRSAIKALSVYLDKEGNIIYDNPNLPICIY